MPAGLAAQIPCETTQHIILDAARGLDWNKVFELLGSYPSAISCQPCGRWNVLHQASFEPNPMVFCRLLELRADAAARTRDGKSVVEVAGLNDPSRVEDKDESFYVCSIISHCAGILQLVLKVRRSNAKLLRR